MHLFIKVVADFRNGSYISSKNCQERFSAPAAQLDMHILTCGSHIKRKYQGFINIEF